MAWKITRAREPFRAVATNPGYQMVRAREPYRITASTEAVLGVDSFLLINSTDFLLLNGAGDRLITVPA